eukprot:5957183-Prymnesium_polylepis.1
MHTCNALSTVASSTSPSSASPCGRPPVIAATRLSACAGTADLRSLSFFSAFRGESTYKLGCFGFVA